MNVNFNRINSFHSLGRELYLSSLACNGVFALEYYFSGTMNTEKHSLLKDGIEYCNYMIDASYELTWEILKDEDKYDILQTIQKYHSREKLLKYMNLAMEIRDNLLDILQNNNIQFLEEKIRSYQHFFNESSNMFLAGEMRNMRRKQELRKRIRSL